MQCVRQRCIWAICGGCKFNSGLRLANFQNVAHIIYGARCYQWSEAQVVRLPGMASTSLVAVQHTLPILFRVTSWDRATVFYLCVWPSNAKHMANEQHMRPSAAPRVRTLLALRIATPNETLMQQEMLSRLRPSAGLPISS